MLTEVFNILSMLEQALLPESVTCLLCLFLQQKDVPDKPSSTA